MALRATRLFPRVVAAHRALSVSAWSRHERLHEVLPPMESFARRHIGPSTRDIQEMLKTCGVEVRETMSRPSNVSNLFIDTTSNLYCDLHIK